VSSQRAAAVDGVAVVANAIDASGFAEQSKLPCRYFGDQPRMSEVSGGEITKMLN